MPTTSADNGRSDLLVDGLPYDVYSLRFHNPSRIIDGIVRKSQAVAGIVVDLSETTVTVEELGDVLSRLRGR